VARALSTWLPRGKGSLNRLKKALTSAVLAGTGITGAVPVSGAVAPPPRPLVNPEASVVNRSQKARKVMLRLPHGTFGLVQHGSHASHASHSSHASHASGSAGSVAPPAPKPRAPVGSPAVATQPPVLGVVDSINSKTHAIVIKDLTPLEAKIEFYFDARTTFTPLGGTAAPVVVSGALPFRVGERVQIQWMPDPAKPSRKMAVVIVAKN
jgi:hypothetical protein